MSTLTLHAPTVDRVRANTWPEINEQVDRATELRLRRAAGAGLQEFDDALARLDTEWNFDRILETEAPLMGLTGVALGLAVDRRFLALPAFVASMMLLHAVHGWYPLLPILRRIGVRSQDEIDRERYAMKALRGDFTEVPPIGSAAAERAAAAWRAVCA